MTGSARRRPGRGGNTGRGHSPRTHTTTLPGPVPIDRLEHHLSGARGTAIPTNDGLVMVSLAWSPMIIRKACALTSRATIWPPCDSSRPLAERGLDRRAGRAVRRDGEHPEFVPKSAGPGWALVGDAGYHRDPAAAQGITDAFRGREHALRRPRPGVPPPRPVERSACRTTCAAGRSGHARFRWASGSPLHDAHATDARPPDLDGADQEWANRYCGLNAETVNPDEFFSAPPALSGSRRTAPAARQPQPAAPRRRRSRRRRSERGAGSRSRKRVPPVPVEKKEQVPGGASR